MADWTAIAGAATDPFAPLTSSLIKALEENPRAIAEGASGAPQIQTAAIAASAVTTAKLQSSERMTTSNVLGQTAGGTSNAVGTYVFAKRVSGTGDVNYGSTLAGSSLRATSALTAQATNSFVDGFAFDTSGSTLSGTWRCMGQFDYQITGGGTDSGKTLFGATLWLRIS
jgi:hypothetical protein